VSAVVGTILMVAVTVVLGVVLYVFVAPLMTQPPTTKPQIPLTTTGWSDGNLSVSFVSLSGAPNIVPSDLRYQIQSVNGTIYFSGPAGTVTAVSNVSVNITYRDADGSGLVSPPDRIDIRVNPQGVPLVRGCSFKLVLGLEVIGAISALP
jgi:FlaG/FlaF family flagellin (archaellin)